jgi:tetratricopeptide (TPR) repeat protein
VRVVNWCPPAGWDGCGVGYTVGVPSYGYYAVNQPVGGYYYNPQANFIDYYGLSTYEPAEIAYGPQAVKQFVGLDRNFALAPLREPPVRLPLLSLVERRARAVAGAKPVVRVANAEYRRKAEKYIADGDTLFKAQNFHSALQRYKLAVNAAPDMTEAHWRQGHAMIATGNYDLAAGSFKRAIALGGDTHRGGFQLTDLYGTAVLTKNGHLEALAGHALERSESSDPYFLLGVMLTYDNQRERAEKFFDRAADLAGISGGYIAAFEPVAAPIDAPPVAAAPSPPVAAPAATPVAIATLETEI